MRLPTCGILIFGFSGSLGILLRYSVGIFRCIQNLTWVGYWSSVEESSIIHKKPQYMGVTDTTGIELYLRIVGVAILLYVITY